MTPRDWSLAPVVEALQAMRGLDLITAVSFLAEIGDLSRFESPRQLMAFLGLTPSERSTGESVKRGGITIHPNWARLSSSQRSMGYTIIIFGKPHEYSGSTIYVARRRVT